MNAVIAAYFDAIEARFLGSPAIFKYQILRREVTPTDGIIRIKADLSDSSLAEFFEYVIEANKQIEIRKYSFHWQDKNGNVIKRWDNAPHHKEFSSHHHLHLADGTVTEITEPLNTIHAILEIEVELLKRK